MDESFDAAGLKSWLAVQTMPSAKYPVPLSCCKWYGCRLCWAGLDSALQKTIGFFGCNHWFVSANKLGDQGLLVACVRGVRSSLKILNM